MKPALSAPAMSVPLHVVEDCAGLGRGFVSAQRTIRRLERSINFALLPWGRAMMFSTEGIPRTSTIFLKSISSMTVQLGPPTLGTKCWGQTACSTCAWQRQIANHSATWAITKAVQTSAVKHCVMPFASSSSANRKPSS